MNSPSNQQDEISLKEFFLTIGRYYREIRNRWMILLLGIAIAAGIAILMHNITPKTYPTKLTFMVEEEGGGAGGMLGGLLGSFGAGLRPGQTNLDRVLSISTSRRIINETLLKRTTVDDKEDFIANHILEYYDFAKYWRKRNREDLIDYRFANDRIVNFTITDQLVLKHVYKRVISPKKKSEALIKTGRDVDAGILYFDGRTLTPELTVAFLDSLFQVVSYYHEGRKVETAQRTYDIIVDKVDSLQKSMTQKQYALASINDRSNNMIRERDRVTSQKLQGEIQTLAYAYAEGVKNREIAGLDLENQTSNLLVLDKPVLPVATDHGSLLMKIIKAVVIGFSLSIFLLCVWLFYRDVMRG